MTERNLLPAWCLLGLIAVLSVECGNSSQQPPGVAITPSGSAVIAGGSVQFGASVSGVNNAVSWTVNGTPGGSSDIGTISSSGLYQAPSNITASMTVKIGASVGAGTDASATVVIVPPGTVAATPNSQVASYTLSVPDGASVSVQFGTDTRYGLATWSQPAPSGGGNDTILVAGMRANTTYHMKATAVLSDGLQVSDTDRTFTTGGPPAPLPAITTQTTAGMTPNPGIELLMLVGAAPNLLVTDLSGNVIWTASGPAGTFPFPAQLLPDGNVLVNWTPPPTVVPIADSTLEEIDLAGNVVRSLSSAQLNAELAAAGFKLTVGATHHAMALLPNGHLVVIAEDTRNFTDLPGYPGTTTVTGDDVVDLDPQWNPVWTWSSFDHLDVNYHPFSFPDWTHGNGLIYSATDGDLILSCRNLSWVMKIQYKDGTGDGSIVWKLGPNGDFKLTSGDWFYNQHYPNLVGSPAADGTYELAVWDNGNTRIDPINGLPCESGRDFVPGGGACFSRGLILDLNETAKTASIVWQDPQQEFSLCCGDIGVLANNDVEMGQGPTNSTLSATSALEVTQTSTPTVVWQLDVSGVFSYRILRIPSLYPGVQW